MNRRPIIRKAHLVDPSSPGGNLTSLVTVVICFDKGGQEVFLCKECKSDKCIHCEAVFDELCAEGVLHA
jgi:hypothetical protein